MEKDIDSKRLEISYPDDIVTTAYLIAFNPDNLVFYGSQSKKAMFLSSGDIDLLESVNIRKAGDLADKIKTIVKNIDKEKLCFLADFKSGLDDYFVVDIGKIANGRVKGFNIQLVKQFVESRDFNKKEDILKLLDKPMTIKRWYHIDELIKKDQVIRWNRAELLHGYKIIRGQKILLEDCIKRRDAMTKVDVIRYLPSLNRFVEVTNYFHIDEHPHEFSNIKFIHDLKANIAKCYFSQKYFKMTKRILSYFLMKKHKTEAINKLYDIVNSNLGILYQVVSELEALIYLFEHYSDLPLDIVVSQFDSIKYRLGSIHEFKFKEKAVDQLLNTLKTMKSETQLYKQLKTLNEHLRNVLNKETYKRLKQLGYVPLPQSLIS